MYTEMDDSAVASVSPPLTLCTSLNVSLCVRWCVCATWYARALEEGAACSIFLKKTNIKTLELIPIDKLKKHALDIS